MKQFNANHMLTAQLRKMVKDAGIVLPKPTAYRDKVMGFMGDRGEYQIGDCLITTDGHYSDENDDSIYCLKFYKGKDAWWHLAAHNGKVYFSPTGCFNIVDREDLNCLNDWEETPFVI